MTTRSVTVEHAFARGRMERGRRCANTKRPLTTLPFTRTERGLRRIMPSPSGYLNTLLSDRIFGGVV